MSGRGAPREDRERCLPNEVIEARMEDPEFPEVLARARQKAKQHASYVPMDDREARLAEQDRKLDELLSRFNARGPAQLRVL